MVMPNETKNLIKYLENKKNAALIKNLNIKTTIMITLSTCVLLSSSIYDYVDFNLNQVILEAFLVSVLH